MTGGNTEGQWRSAPRNSLAIALCFAFEISTGCGQGVDNSDPLALQCSGQLNLCHAACVDFTTSPTSCGGCGIACPLGHACVHGQCSDRCVPSRQPCGSVCVDSATDPDHCGNCDTACAAGHTCDTGRCSSNCLPQLTNCGGACVSLLTDRDNCGACAHACGDLSCKGGVCHGCTLDFAPGMSYAPGPSPSESIAIADVNDDNKPDLVIVIHGDDTTDGHFSVLLNQGAGVFGRPVDYDIGFLSCSHVRLADLDGDNRPDVALGCGTRLIDDRWFVFFNEGGGTFGAPVTGDLGPPRIIPNHNMTAGRGVADLVALDIDGDGKKDIVVQDSRGTIGFLNEGDRRFSASVPVDMYPEDPADPQFWQWDWSAVGEHDLGNMIAAADFDGDGKPDLAKRSETTSYDLLLPLSVISNRGAGRWSDPFVYWVGSTMQIVTGDFNGDGSPDLVIGHSNPLYPKHAFDVLLNRGDGVFKQPLRLVQPDFPHWLGVADFDGDGQQDIAYTRDVGPFVPGLPDLITVLVNRGKADFSGPLHDFGAGPHPGPFAIGDLDNDGKPDLAIANTNVSVLLNRSRCQ